MRKIIFWNSYNDLQGKEYISDSVKKLLDPIINDDKKSFEEQLIREKNLSPESELCEIIIDGITIHFDVDKKNIYIANSFLY